jgi:DNA-binding response OmpR family regulator
VPRVLVIDDDAGTLFGYKRILRAGGHEVATAALGEDGVAAAQRDQFDVVLCDQRLLDQAGTEVVRQIHRNCPQTSIVLVTAWGTPELVIEAKRNGATSCADKPLIGDELLAVVDEALRLQEGGVAAAGAARIGYAAQRWADLVFRAARVSDDPKTVLAWCRRVGLARSTLKGWCKAADVTPKASVAFVRLLHLVLHHSGERWNLQRRLDIIDRRTAEDLIRRAGFAPDSPIPDPESFLSQQRLIVSEELINAIRERSKRGQGHHSPSS